MTHWHQGNIGLWKVRLKKPSRREGLQRSGTTGPNHSGSAVHGIVAIEFLQKLSCHHPWVKWEFPVVLALMIAALSNTSMTMVWWRIQTLVTANNHSAQTCSQLSCEGINYFGKWLSLKRLRRKGGYTTEDTEGDCFTWLCWAFFSSKGKELLCLYIKVAVQQIFKGLVQHWPNKKLTFLSSNQETFVQHHIEQSIKGLLLASQEIQICLCCICCSSEEKRIFLSAPCPI